MLVNSFGGRNILSLIDWIVFLTAIDNTKGGTVKSRLLCYLDKKLLHSAVIANFCALNSLSRVWVSQRAAFGDPVKAAWTGNND